ncbi:MULTISPECIES: hypothetical protein [unclassified Microcoleus]|uniref:hypothetical protein n=1 Tax=unclassified Microcoleus TaxID=2642155 RepID=UPI002FD55467
MTNFLRATGDRTFWYRKVEIPLLLFHGRRAIALLASKGREPVTTFSHATGDRTF